MHIYAFAMKFCLDWNTAIVKQLIFSKFVQKRVCFSQIHSFLPFSGNEILRKTDVIL